MATISASIVLFNQPLREVSGLLQELIDQGVTRVYIVDNSDASFDTLGGALPPTNLEFIRSAENLGYGRGHNVAIDRARREFKYHIICNPDVHLNAGAIPTLHQYMESHSDVGIAMPKLLNVDASIQYCCRRSPVIWDYVSQLLIPSVGAKRRRRLEMRDHDYNQEMEVPCLSGCFLFARLDALTRLGGFDPGFFLYFEDFDLSMRARMVTRTSYVPQASIIHERQSGHRKSWRLKWLFLRSALRYFNRWGYFLSKA